MFTNPFSPIFGGKPEVFFGRDDILSRFELAMIDSGSEDRAFFFTGTRGSGKTALLEQLSFRATEKKRRVIDLGPEDTIAQLVANLSGFDEITTTLNPKANVNFLGVSGGISSSVSKTRHIGRESLQTLLLEICARERHGILVTVDEVQKVPLEDISSLCNAFQMASRKGYDIMLAVAGLPYAHAKITEHEGCTYLRRASHEELALFSWEECSAAFSSIFRRVEGLKISTDFIDRLNQVSYGHPYLMQLLGYHLIVSINAGNPAKSHIVSEKEMDFSIPSALLAYEQRALKPLLNEASKTEKEYLIAMAETLNDEHLALTASVAKQIGVNQKSLSKARAHLIDNGIIAAPERGKIMFCIPYLADYVQKADQLPSAVEMARRRGV